MIGNLTRHCPTSVSRHHNRIDAVIFDRDGVLIHDCGYPHLPEHLRWTDGARPLIAQLNHAGVKVLVASNQSGVARGYFRESDVQAFHALMQAQLAGAGARLDDIAYCPHLPDAPVAAYARTCTCRKPAPGLLLTLLERHEIAASHALMVGDKPSDLEAAAAAGIPAQLFAGGDLLESLRETLEARGLRLRPDRG